MRDVIVLSGNHDFALMKEFVFPRGEIPGFLSINEKEFEEMTKRIKESKVLRNYCYRHVKNTNKGRFHHSDSFEGEKIAYAHSLPFVHEEGINWPLSLWMRIYDSYDALKAGMFIDGKFLPGEHIEKNALEFFREMHGYFWLLFRGHDHCNGLVSRARDLTSLRPLNQHHLNGEKIKLEKSLKYIATIGDFSSGHYAVFNQFSSELEFCEEVTN